MHLQRWLTSLIALPIVLFLIAKGGGFFIFLICLVCAISLHEYYGIVFSDFRSTHPIPLWGLGSGCLLILAAGSRLYIVMLLLFALNFLATAALCVFKNGRSGVSADGMAKQVLGMIYIPLMLSFLVLLRIDPFGITWIYYLLCIIFAGDVGALYVGTYLGKHKLLPVVSPKKTIEGAVGGLAANLLVGCLINVYLPRLPGGLDMPMISWTLAIPFFLMAGILGQVGDLFESLFKRAANIKDSGKILPGHGGLLDRIDALLFAAPVAYFFKEFIAGL